MKNMDQVIRHAAEAARNNATFVNRALTAFVQTPSDEGAQRALRAALVAQAEGVDGGAHDGATQQARCEASEAALRAWDGDGQ